MKIKTLFLLLIISLSSFLSSCDEKDQTLTPQFLLSNTDILAPEDNPNGLVSIPIYLSKDYSEAVSVDYESVDSTAVAGTDYVEINSGTLTFQPGELVKEITINILPNAEGKENVYFNIRLSNPVNSRLSKSSLRVKIVNVDFENLAWSEEFMVSTLNTTIWNYDEGGGGWGNNELQTYTDLTDNVHLDTGYLHITVLNPSGSSYTSGRINTNGKKEFTYGRMDIRAKLPEGQGIWPAIWMLGSNFNYIGWPKCGEIDIMELLGHEPSTSYGAVHWDNNGHVSRTNSFSLNSGKFSAGFHVFSLVWTPNKLIWMVDNQQFLYLTKVEMPNFPFDLPQFFVLNVAVGGNWPGAPDETTIFPQNLIVDYIRVYQ
jgi:hypothetical protein